jgi:hypothetical protein
MIGRITPGMKQTGKRSAGKPHAAFDVAGAGNVTMVAGLRSTTKVMELPPAPTVRAPALDPTCERPAVQLHRPTHPLYCTRNRKGNFRVGLRTEKSRLRRALMRLQDQMRRMRHSPLKEQADHLNQMLRGHYAYYGIAGNIRALRKVHRAVECYWRKMLSSRSWQGTVWWKQFQRIKDRFPLLQPKLHFPYGAQQAPAITL